MAPLDDEDDFSPDWPPVWREESWLCGVAIRLHNLRVCCGATQRQLAQASGVSVSTIRRYEQGRLRPRAPQFVAIARALNARLDYLLRGDDPPSAEELSEMRISWTLGRVSPAEADAILLLIDGILAQIPRTAAAGEASARAARTGRRGGRSVAPADF